VSWLQAFGHLERVGVEGTGAYGAGLTRQLRAAGVTVVEVNRPDREALRAVTVNDLILADQVAKARANGRTWTQIGPCSV
jgi:transposase